MEEDNRDHREEEGDSQGPEEAEEGNPDHHEVEEGNQVQEEEDTF